MDILYLQEIETLKLKMEELCNSFAKESKRLEDALSERFEHSLDMRSVGGEGYGLTKEIHAKLQELLERPAITLPRPPPTEAAMLQEFVDGICYEADYDFEEEEDVVLTFEGGLAVQEQVWDALVRAKTKEQLGKRKLKVGYHMATSIPYHLHSITPKR
jgi:hypothetical protein